MRKRYSLHIIFKDYFKQFKGLCRTSDFSVNHFYHNGLAEIIRIDMVTFCRDGCSSQELVFYYLLHQSS